MYYEGKIYRPWMEANSLLIQTTLGCTHNKCTFCDMFREKRFRVRKNEEIFKDIEEARQVFPRKIDHAIANHPVTKNEVLVTSPW